MRFLVSTESTVAPKTTTSAAKGSIFAGSCAKEDAAKVKPSVTNSVTSNDFFKITPK